MKKIALVSIGFSIFLGACGGDDASKSKVGEATAQMDMAMDVRSLPDPCVLMTTDTARELLQVEEVKQSNLSNEQIVSRMCSYKDAAEESNKMVMMSLTLFRAQAMSSAVDSRSELISKASELAGGLQPAVREDIGNLAFVFDNDGATRLQVLTGMGGTSESGDEVTSELQLGYAINLPELDAARRESLLTDLARQHLAILGAAVQ